MYPGNVWIDWLGQESGCRPAIDPDVDLCEGGEEILFTPAAFGYSYACSTHSFEWSFGDGSPSVFDRNPRHAYTSAGRYLVTLRVSTPSQTLTLSSAIVVRTTCAPPHIVNQSRSETLQAGTKRVLTLVATGSSPSIVWYAENGADATVIGSGPAVEVGPVTEPATYWATVTNACGFERSESITLTPQASSGRRRPAHH